jgi:hypothetical protein
MVKRVTPSERLLLFRLEDGWEPLCNFLGKKVPNIPFPKVNETAAIKEKIDLYLAEGYKRGQSRYWIDQTSSEVGSDLVDPTGPDRLADLVDPDQYQIDLVGISHWYRGRVLGGKVQHS